MDLPIVKFNKKNRPEFYKVLQKRVNQYFKDNNISKHGNANMKIKTVFMLSLYFIPLAIMLAGLATNVWGMLSMWVLMGFGMAGIGLSVMHDANHGSYSDSSRVNHIVGMVINFVGGYQANWKIQHNVLHHSYTNIHGFDEDIDKGVIRLSPDQERKPFFKYQAFYAPFLYSIMTFYWLVGKDFEQLYRYDRKNLLAGQGLTFRKALGEILFTKSCYVLLTIVLPFIILPHAWWQILIGFLMMQLISGLILALIFQMAHIIEETDFYTTDEQGSVENNWAIHQMHTTSNFANDSIFFSWLIGGLNYQVEHHLFPHICHVHYRGIAGIVKQTAREFNVPYNHHETYWGALKSHFVLLNQLGTGEYDRRLAKRTEREKVDMVA